MRKSRKILALGMGLNLAWVSACNKDYPKLNPRELDFSSAQPLDSARTSLWKDYLEGKKLLEAWTPPMGSAWAPYVKPTLFTSLDEISTQAKPIYGVEEQAAEKTAKNFAHYNKIEKDTAIFLDLLGDQSVTWAVTLAREQGVQPVATFNNWPHQKGILRAERVLGALIYYAAEMKRLKQEGKLAIDAPPVFMLDYYRLSTQREPDANDFDNRYYLLEADLPSPEFLKREGIKRVLYVVPFDTIDKEQDDLNDYFSKLEKTGLSFALIPAQSYVDENQIQAEKEKKEKEQRHALHTHTYIPWFLFFHGGRGYTPVPRQTIFSNPSGSPGAGKFVRSAGGGFGGYHGLHSGSGG
jgi:hypothetical protein